MTTNLLAFSRSSTGTTREIGVNPRLYKAARHVIDTVLILLEWT